MTFPRYSSVEEVIQKLDDYFDTHGQDANNPYTITGLILHLGFTSRQSFYNYLKKTEFKDVLERARLRVENSYERLLFSPTIKPTGAIFALKSMGWQEQAPIQEPIEILVRTDRDIIDD